VSAKSGPGVVVFHEAGHVRAAIEVAGELGVALILRTAPGAAAYAGPRYLKRLVERAGGGGAEAHIDCGDDAGLVLTALEAGWRRVLFSGRPAVQAKLAAIAAKQGSRVSATRASALDLLGISEPAAACREFLRPGGRKSTMAR
jgi:hypothetical protein